MHPLSEKNFMLGTCSLSLKSRIVHSHFSTSQRRTEIHARPPSFVDGAEARARSCCLGYYCPTLSWLVKGVRLFFQLSRPFRSLVTTFVYWGSTELPRAIPR